MMAAAPGWHAAGIAERAEIVVDALDTISRGGRLDVWRRRIAMPGTDRASPLDTATLLLAAATSPLLP
jgi:hypothetical protein